MSRRTERVSEAIREVVSRAILFELKDPRVSGVTVTRGEVTGDLRHAKVYVSIMGTETEQRLSLRGLESARGFLQRKVAERLETRYTPHIEIVVDDSIKKSLEMSRILRDVLPHEDAPSPESSESGDASVDENDSEEDESNA
ncbi:30S ribosome-binding factor RbfA [bacterium]|nr:30S ribosome-binding factor RbfA [bacterium]